MKSYPKIGPAGHPTERKRGPVSLNVYVNRFPEWSRAMAQGSVVSRRILGVRCPKCGSADTRQSLTRTMSDFLLFLFDYTNARCRNCSARFRVWRPRLGQELGETAAESE